MNKNKKWEKKHLLLSVLSIGLLLFVWWLFTEGLGMVKPTVMPGPIRVLRTFIVKFYDPQPEGATMLQHLAASLRVTLTGYGLAVVISVPLGILMAWYEPVDIFLRPIFDLLKPVPAIAWVPVMISLFGIGLMSKAAAIFLAAMVPIIVNSYSGIRQTKEVHIWVGRTFGAGRLEILRKVAVPSALPMIFTGLRVALGSAWMTLVGAELIASTEGLGYMIQRCRGIFRPDVIIAGMIAIGATGALLTGILTLIERHFVKGGRWS